MKKMKSIFTKAASVCAAIFTAAALSLTAAGCDMLQDSLSSEQQKTVDEDTGSASLAGATWYYNGSSSTDMSSVTNETLCINFGKKTALSSAGLKGNFIVTYQDKNSNTSTKELSLAGGFFNTDCTSYYLYMTPVLALLDGSSTSDGTLSVTVKASGFVCAEGDQQGRSIDTFKKSINVAPLYTKTTMTSVSFSTVYNTLGNAVAISLEGTAALSDDAGFTATFTDAPSGFTAENLALSMNATGTAILLTPDVDLYGKDFSASVTVKGLIPALTGEPVNQTFKVEFAPNLITIDGKQDDNWTASTTSAAADASGDGFAGVYTQSGIDATNLYVTSDANNLYVGLKGALGVNWNDAIVIMIDKVASDGTDVDDLSTFISDSSTYGWLWPAETTTVTNGEPDIVLWHRPGSPDNSGYGAVDLFAKSTGSSSWSQIVNVWPSASGTTPDSSIMSVSPQGWINTSPASFVEYSFNLASVGLTAGEKVRVIAVLSSNWGTKYATDSVPDPSTVSTNHSTAAFDFDSALSYTVGSSSGTVTTYKPATPAYLASSAQTYYTISLMWPAVYNADSYTLYRSDSASGTYSSIKTGITDTSYTDSSLSSGTTYYYKVSAVNTTGESDKSSTCAASTVYKPTSLSAPVASASPASATSVKVSWATVSYAESYTVSYATTESGSYTDATTSATGTSYTVTGLTAVTKYYFKVTAANATFSLTSTASTAVNAYTYPTIALDGTLESAWTNTDIASTSSSSYSDSVSYQNMTNLYITNDADYVYVAVKFGSAPGESGTNSGKGNINLLFDTAATTNKTSDSGGWMIPATTCTYSNDGVDYAAYEKIAWTESGNSTLSNIDASSATYSWNSSVGGYAADSAVVEYKIAIASIGSVGDTVKLFASISQYTYVSADAETLNDCIPSTAATVSDSGATVAVDFSKALSYTIR